MTTSSALPPSGPRALIHCRDVICRGYAREDGLWDIEGHLVDTKTYPFANQDRGTIEPGVPVHGMWLRLTVDLDLVIRDVAAVTEFGPFHDCATAADAYRALIGLTIGPGFRGEARRRVGGMLGCTHLTELLGPLATTAYQTLIRARDERRAAARAGEGRSDETTKPAQPGGDAGERALIDTCHALRADGRVVARAWPDRAVPPRDDRGSGESGVRSESPGPGR